MNKNEIYRLEIEDITAEGVGVGKLNSMAIFVPKTAVGDIIDCKIVKNKKKYAFGIVDKIIEASSHRQESDCEVFGKCGGCVYRHINYDFEAKLKENRVKETVARIGGYKDFPMEKICSAENRNGYRNKAQIPLSLDKDGNLIMGFYGKHSHRVVDIKACPLQPEIFNKAMDVFRAWHKESKVSIYNELEHKGILRHLYLRYAQKTGEFMLCLVATKKEIPQIELLVSMIKDEIPSLKTLVVNVNKEKTNVVLGKKCINIYGDGFITDNLCGLDFKISPLSFYQVNRDQAEKLYKKAHELADLKSEENLLDLYCGTGTIGLSMIGENSNLIGVEIVPQAIEDAKQNAKSNGKNNCQFICADALEAAKQLKERNITADVIVLDPPRKGLDMDLIKLVSQMTPDRIVYISCDVATLARDLSIFREEGYKLDYLQAFDLFPATAHVESIARLIRL